MEDFNLKIDWQIFTGQEVMKLIEPMSILMFDKRLVWINNAVEIAKKVKELWYYNSKNDAKNFLDFAIIVINHIKFAKALDEKRKQKK